MINKFRFSALTIVLILALSLSGCGIISFNFGNKKPSETTDKSETTEDELNKYEGDYDGKIEEMMNDLSGKTYSGGTFQIAFAGNNIVTSEESTPTVIAKDIDERNAAVEAELDITIASKKVNIDTMLTEIKNSIKADSYFADAIIIPQKHIGAYVAGGALMNLRTLPGFDTNSEYIYPTSLASGTGGSSIYAVSGPALLEGDTLSCIYFNKDIIEKLGLISPYELVSEGKWTYDKYIEYATSVSKLDGEYYSYCTQNVSTNISDLFFFAYGGKLTESNVGYYPVLTLGNEANKPLVEKVSATVNMAKSFGSSLDSVNKFLSGNVMFLVDKTSTVKSLANASIHWGIVPLPKLNEAQESYRTLVDYSEAKFMGTVATAPNYDEVADVISALNIMAYGYSRDAYITNTAYYYLQDNTSMKMLSYVLSNPAYDFAYSFSETNSYVSNGTFMAVRNTVAGISSLERYLNMYNSLFENSMYSMFNTD